MIYRVVGSDFNHWGVSSVVGVWYFNSILRALEFTNMFVGLQWSVSASILSRSK